MASPKHDRGCNGKLVWTGTVGHGQAIITFTVTHTRDYGDVATNTVEVTHTMGGESASVALSLRRRDR